MAYAGRNNIYEAAIRRMVVQSLEAQERAFAAAHGADTDGQLLSYLRDQAYRLGHAPWPREILGGTVIEKRFGAWKTALNRAGLPEPGTPDLYSSFARVREETARQRGIYREKKARKKALALERKQKGGAKSDPTA